MLAHDVWKTVTVDHANLRDELCGLLDTHAVRGSEAVIQPLEETRAPVSTWVA